MARISAAGRRLVTASRGWSAVRLSPCTELFTHNMAHKTHLFWSRRAQPTSDRRPNGTHVPRRPSLEQHCAGGRYVSQTSTSSPSSSSPASLPTPLCSILLSSLLISRGPQNTALLPTGNPCLFDCIEFNDKLAQIDVLYDVAFLLMDLCVRGLQPLANRALNR